MANIALIVAAGRGQRTKLNIPKQFINIYDKPIIIYTLENFQKHPDINSIIVSCLDGWHDILWAYAKQYKITKLKNIVLGGNTVQESYKNGVFALKGVAKDNDIIVLHDGIRPMIDEAVLSDVIVTCKKYGNAVSSLPYNEQIFIKQDAISTTQYINRDTLQRVQTPQAYRFKKLLWAYEKAFKEEIGIYGSSYANTMMVDLGETLYFASGSERNIKITTAEDIEIFKAFLNLVKN